MMTVCFGGNGRVLGIIMSNDGHDVQIQYSYGIIDINDPLPTILNFICSPGLQCDSLNATYVSKALVTSGETFPVLWSDMATVQGSVTLNTSRGSVTSNLTRTIYAPQAILTFTSTHPGYVDGGTVSTDFTVGGLSNIDCNRQPCSPDGRVQAWDTAGTLQAPEITSGAVLRNPTVTCSGDYSPFSSILQLAFADANGTILQGAMQGPKVTATIREWSWGCTGHIGAEQFVLRPISDPNTVTLAFTFNNLLVVPLPNGVTNASLQLSVNNKPISFVVGTEPADALQVKLLSTTPTAAETIYTYIANQSVPGAVTNLLLSTPIRSPKGDAAAWSSARTKLKKQGKPN